MARHEGAFLRQSSVSHLGDVYTVRCTSKNPSSYAHLGFAHPVVCVLCLAGKAGEDYGCRVRGAGWGGGCHCLPGPPGCSRTAEGVFRNIFSLEALEEESSAFGAFSLLFVFHTYFVFNK